MKDKNLLAKVKKLADLLESQSKQDIKDADRMLLKAKELKENIDNFDNLKNPKF